MPIRFILVAVVTLVSTPVFADPTEIPVRINESGAIVVPVSINGRGPFQFLLDTGSSHSVVSRSLTEHLQLRFVARTPVLTSTGSEWRPVVKLDQTTIGGVQSEGLLASVAPSAQLAAIAHGVEGIIGQDFLLAFNYTLDYRRKRLVWSDGRTEAGDIRLPLIVQEGRYLVQVTPAGNEPPVLLVPDSGASGFVMFEREGRTRLQLEPAPQRMAVLTVSGRQDVRTMLLRELPLGEVTVRNQPVAVIARDPRDVLEGDGLLPLHLFASVSFNAREQCLVLRR